MYDKIIMKCIKNQLQKLISWEDDEYLDFNELEVQYNQFVGMVKLATLIAFKSRTKMQLRAYEKQAERYYRNSRFC